jgi:perosamine synthetase
MTTTNFGGNKIWRPAILERSPQPLITDEKVSLLGQEERESLLRVFDATAARGGRESDEVEKFKHAIAAYFGVADAVATVSATAALQLAMSAYGIGSGDEVLVSPYSFAATAHAILHTGATPVFTDIDEETLCISPVAAKQNIGPKTKAILVVQIAGKPGRMQELKDLAHDEGLILIEDAAQAHGARYNGKYVGALADAGVLSFSPKLMTSGRGGVILLNDEKIAETCRKYRFHGLASRRGQVKNQLQMTVNEPRHFIHEFSGYSLSLSALQAAVLMPQIQRLDRAFEVRRKNALFFAERIGQISGLKPVLGVAEGESNFYMLEVLYDESSFNGLTRDQFVTCLSWEGVPVSPVAVTRMLQYDNPSLEEFRAKDCPFAEGLVDRLIIFGHPLQSLIFNGDRSHVECAANALANVASCSAELASHFR